MPPLSAPGAGPASTTRSSRCTDAACRCATSSRTPILFLDALIVKVRDAGAVRNKACYVAIAVNLDGERGVLGIWFQSSEGAKFWLAVLNELNSAASAMS